MDREDRPQKNFLNPISDLNDIQWRVSRRPLQHQSDPSKYRNKVLDGVIHAIILFSEMLEALVEIGFGRGGKATCATVEGRTSRHQVW